MNLFLVLVALGSLPTVFSVRCCCLKPKPEPSRFEIITSTKLNWMNALLYCRRKGMHLAHINSSEEQNEVARMLDAISPDNYFVWISGTRLLQNDTSFHWASTGQPFLFTSWAGMEPNNSENNEQCVQLLRRTDNVWAWNDNNCAQEVYFMCRS